jgi:mannosyltransferase OCH1-like enzyme
MTRIPKILHFIWVGDESLCPESNIDTWRAKNPSYKIRVWGNEELHSVDWVNSQHIKAMLSWQLCGVADLMRYEILHQHGGVYVDADSVCLRSLDDWLLEPNEFACWENEFARPGLIGTSCLASTSGSSFFKEIIDDVKAAKTVVNDEAWITVGPCRVTRVWQRSKHSISIYPSHYFYPTHFTGHEYKGAGPVFAQQQWDSTFGKGQSENFKSFLIRKYNLQVPPNKRA